MHPVFQTSLVSWRIDSVQSQPQISCTGALVRQILPRPKGELFRVLGRLQVMVVVVQGIPLSRNHSLDAKRRRCWNSSGVLLRCRTGRAGRPHSGPTRKLRDCKEHGIYIGWPASPCRRDTHASLAGGMSPAPMYVGQYIRLFLPLDTLEAVPRPCLATEPNRQRDKRSWLSHKRGLMTCADEGTRYWPRGGS